MANKAAWRRVWPPSAAFVVFVAIWEACCAWLPIDPWILPSPSQIVIRMVDERSLIAENLAATLQLSLLGLALGTAAGIAMAISLHLVPFLRSALSPFVIASQNVPLIALAPVLMVWFGFGLTPKLILLTIVCFFPVGWSMLSGLERAESHLREYLSMIGATRWQIFRRLELPASLPSLLTGLKITVAYSVTASVVAEWLGAEKGIGKYLILKFKGYDIAAMFGAVICIVVLCLVLYGGAAWLEKRVLDRRFGGRPTGAGDRK